MEVLTGIITDAEVVSSTEVILDSKLPDTEVNVTKSITAEVSPDNYVLSSGGMYGAGFTGAAPTWLLDAIQQELTTGTGSVLTVLQNMQTLIDSLQLGVNQNISQIESAILSQSALETSVVSRLDGNEAAILDVATTRVTPTEAQTIATQVQQSTFGLDASAFIGNIASTYVSPTSAIAQEVHLITAELNGVAASITTIEEVNISQGTSISQLTTSTGISIANLQSQIDGSISTYFQSYVPTLLNAPANGWTTPTLQANHVGDLFYDRTTGYGYRFAYEDIVDTPDAGIIYSWIRITDVDVTTALANAANAQATADGKRTVFYTNTTPVPMVENGITIPIEIGDMWVHSDTKVTKVAVAVSPLIIWGDITNTPTENALLALTDLEEARDGNVVVYYETSTTIPVGMTYGDYLVDIDSWNGSAYTVYRYENTTGGSSGTLAWHINTGETARAISSGYRAQVLAGTAQSTADGKIKTWYQISAPVLTASDVGDMWVDTDNANKLQVWSGTVWTDPTSAQGTQAYTWSAKASKFVTAPDGSITGWQVMDGTGQASSMTIAANTFKIVSSATWDPVNQVFVLGSAAQTPFSISGSDIVFNGKVSFNSVTDVVLPNNNIANPAYSDFEYATVPAMEKAANASLSISTTSHIGTKSLQLAAYGYDSFAYMSDSSSNYNISITPYGKWVVSCYVYLFSTNSPTTTNNCQIYVKTKAAGSHYAITGSVPVGVWTRVAGLIDLSVDSSTACVLRLDNDAYSGVGIVYTLFDGLMMEKQLSTSTLPSSYTVPGTNGGTLATLINSNTTTIDGGKITTGSITTDQIAANTITTNDIALGTGLVNGYVQSSDFTTIGGAGFRLKSNAAGTSADPTIYGAYIKGGVVDGDSIIGGSITNLQSVSFNLTKSYGQDGTYTLGSFSLTGIGQSLLLISDVTEHATGSGIYSAVFHLRKNGIVVKDLGASVGSIYINNTQCYPSETTVYSLTVTYNFSYSGSSSNCYGTFAVLQALK